jgi:hypothetical protein
LFGHDYLLGYLYVAVKDVMEGVVLLMVLWADLPSGGCQAGAAAQHLGGVPGPGHDRGMLMVSDLLYDGARYNLIVHHNNPGHLHFFVIRPTGLSFCGRRFRSERQALISGLGADTGHASWW